jgi:hypothetical protein
MDNNNPNIPTGNSEAQPQTSNVHPPVENVPQPQPLPPTESSIPTPPPAAGGGIIGFMNSIPQKAKSILSIKKLLIVGGAVLLGIILLWVVIMLTKRRPAISNATPLPVPSALPIATPTPTKYATDSAILQIEDNIRILDKNLSNTDLQEDTLKPRDLEWVVTFK